MKLNSNTNYSLKIEEVLFVTYNHSKNNVEKLWIWPIPEEQPLHGAQGANPDLSQFGTDDELT